MDLGNQLILFSAGLVLLSIFVGLISSRIGAPLLLVFLVLGMLFGEEGPGGIVFNNFHAAYMLGSLALAIILFDGGLRTPRASFRLAQWPSLVLATGGVLLTAALTGAFSMWALGLFTWIEGLLVGSIIASTDAAAVMFLLQAHNARLEERVKATLEVESGLNDPMAIFLTLVCIELLIAANGAFTFTWEAAVPFLTMFALQIAGGAVAGIAGGYTLLWLVNRLNLASGLYPVMALAFALFVFAGAQILGMSGFLAVYLTGLILGNYRHRATQLINRFQDGLAWLSQIVMFLVLGLLVTPSALLPNLIPALAIAVFLIVVARPLAVLACLLPFRVNWPERIFISWVGLRGAVPIFLGTLPILAGVEGADEFFTVAYVVVVTSLIVQGWTVGPAARYLGLDLPPLPETPQRVDMDLPAEVDRDMVAYVIGPHSALMNRSTAQVPLPPDTEIVSVIRDGMMRPSNAIGLLAPGDHVILTVPYEKLDYVDALFASSSSRRRRGAPRALGEFSFDGHVKAESVAAFYGFPMQEDATGLALADYLAQLLDREPVVGDRARAGDVELVVQEVADEQIVKVGITLEPEDRSLRGLLGVMAEKVRGVVRWQRLPPAA